MFSRSRAHADARVLTLLVLPLLAGATFLPAVAGASTFRPSPADSLVPVTISFRATVGTKPFACGTTYQDVGTSRASITASDFRLYVHDIRLINARGDTVRANLRDEAPWQNADVALLDFEDGTTTCSNGTPETRDVVVVMAPPGRYRGVAFTVGVPFEHNHLDVAQSPPPLTLSRL